MIVIANYRRPVVRIKAAWADAWTTLERGSYEVPGRIVEGSTGGTGSATLVTIAVGAVNREEDAPATPTIGRDWFVQIGAEDPELPASDTDAIRWLWLGFVESSSFVHDGTEITGSEVSFIVRYTHSLLGLGALFHRMIVRRSWVLVGGTPCPVPRCLPFNGGGDDGAIRGNRSASDTGGRYVHDLGHGATVEKWTAMQALTALLADHNDAAYFPNWPTFAIGGQTSALDYVVDADVDGQPFDQVLNEMAGTGRGCSWTIEPDASGTGTVTIRITSGLAAEVSLPDGGTLPASDRIVAALDAGESHHRFAANIIDRPRRWTLRGTCRTTLTVRFDPNNYADGNGMVRGWPSANDAQAGSVDPAYANVYRYFLLDQAWTGASDNGSDGCAKVLVQEANGAYSGDRSRTSGTFLAPAARLSAELVFPEVASSDGTSANALALSSWVSSPTTVQIARDAPRDRMRLWYLQGGLLSGQDYDLRVSNDPPGLTIGRDEEDAADLKALATSAPIYVTLTVVEPLPVLVSSEPAGDPGNDTLVVTAFEVHRVAGNTIVGRDATGAPSRTSAEILVRDDRPRMRALLAALGPYLTRSGEATYEDKLDLHAADYLGRTGSLVQTVEDGRKVAGAVSVNSVVTSRSWSFEPGSYGTLIRLEPLSLDIRSFI